MRDAHQIFNQKIQLPFKLKKSVLALGAQTKNRICFVKGNCAIFSPVHPDLNNAADFFSFEKDAKLFFKKHPQIIAYDLHPDYQSTKFASQLRTTDDPSTWFNFAHHKSLGASGRRATQHHHAHIASCMAENRLNNQKIIGAAFDGTGLGTDNTLWGAEFLICDYKGFKRAAHLREIPLLGGERAILEPWRVAAAWLYVAYKDKFLNLGLKFTKGIDKKKWEALRNMYSNGFNSVPASSMGRLFDAAASLILAKYKSNSEAEPAIELENLSMKYGLSTMNYNFEITHNGDVYILNPVPMFKEIVADLKAKQPQEKMGYRFHLTVAEMIRKTCLILRKKSKINKIALSGGVFQNTLLLRMSLDLLYKEGFKVFTHKKLSNNDSGIALGQAVIAGFGS